MANNPLPQGDDAVGKELEEYWKTRYWVQATMGEAFIGLEDEATAKELLEDAYSKASSKWMQESTEIQIEKLKTLLNNSPLQFIK
jgi:hypothetical protein